MTAVTLGDALDDATRQLASASPTPRVDAEALLMHLLDLDRPALITHSAEALTAPQRESYRQLLLRRAAGEPIAYVVGTREFWSLPLRVTPAVLIPRAETELLVDKALAHVLRESDYLIADLGTGSGAVALAIAHERPRAKIIATDMSADALEIARGNAHRLGFGNIEFHPGDWFTPLGNRHFDVIVSNPPYICANDPHLQTGDLRAEPTAALVGGVDGLACIRDIVAGARSHLRPDGWLLFEHGYDQADSVADLLRAAGLHRIQCHRDLANQPRVTEACASV